jgi:hypothetical protein
MPNAYFPLCSDKFEKRGSAISRKTPPSAKQHYLKQARYFPGQTTTTTHQKAAPNVGATQGISGHGGSTLIRKSSFGLGAGLAAGGGVAGGSYVPSFGGGTQSRPTMLGGGKYFFFFFL